MTDRQPNGLAALTAQRERARRSMPPPRHPVAATTPAEAPEVAQSVGAPVLGSSGRPSPAVSDRTPGAPAEVNGAPGAIFKVTLYLDSDTDEFMEAARVEGLTSRPKVDVSRSAVVRLALRRLMDQMTPAEVKSYLQAQPVRTGGPGRKRR